MADPSNVARDRRPGDADRPCDHAGGRRRATTSRRSSAALSRLEHAVADAVEEEAGADAPSDRRARRRGRRRRAGRQARQLDHRPGGRARRLRHPLRARGAELRVRFRVDGVLLESTPCPRAWSPRVVSRIKIMADLDIAERRLPQDGRIGLTRRPPDRPARRHAAERHGESVVLRILDKDGVVDRARLHSACAERPRALREGAQPLLRRRARHRPDRLGQVDDALRALSGCSTRPRRTSSRSRTRSSTSSTASPRSRSTPKAGLTFATGLRSMLRADPDVIMVGEIRDRETAQIAIESALTGHLVLSTLHTNDAPSALTRLDRDGHRAVPGRLVGLLRRRPAARPRCSADAASSRSRSRPSISPRTASTSTSTSTPTSRGLLALRRQRLPRADRPVRGDEGHPEDPRADPRLQLGRPDRDGRDPRGDDDPSARTAIQKVVAWPDVDRRSPTPQRRCA